MRPQSCYTPPLTTREAALHYAGEIAALGTAICWACGSNFFAAAGKRLGSWHLNRLRITAAAVLLTLSLTVVRGSPLPLWATPSQVGWLALSGLVGFVFGDSFYFRSLVILGPGKAALISSLAPVFTALIAWPVLGETLGPLALVGMALTLGGVAWVVQGRMHEERRHAEGSVFVGVVAGVLSGLGQAVGYVISKLALREGLDPLSATVIRVLAATVAVWILALFGRDVVQSVRGLRDRTAALTMAAGAFFGPFLGVTLSLVALKHTSAGVAASITAFYPVLTILISSKFHHEKITGRIVLGSLVSVAGVVVLFLK
ncbi:MAG: DMT family transporter [Candidatus Eisenbacteria bacterium]|nr:DMT family transporter [Candidatus Eisenbacteria bacterium]